MSERTYMKTFIVAFVLAVILVFGTVRASAAPLTAENVLSLTNQVRTDSKLGGLKRNPLLDQAAQAKALDQSRKGYFSHISPDGRVAWNFIRESGYRYSVAGENLGVYFSDSDSLVKAWMGSKYHRANLIDSRFTETGIGIVEGEYKGYKTYFVVQFFGTPK